MSEFRNNKHYSLANAYHKINLNDNRLSPLAPNFIIHSINDSSMTEETHLTSIVISSTTKDGKLVEHAVARDGKWNHYNTNTNRTHSVKLNGTNVSDETINIVTSVYKRDIFSSKITTSAGGSESGSETPAFSQTWVG
jgi:hypothetical protein